MSDFYDRYRDELMKVKPPEGFIDKLVEEIPEKYGDLAGTVHEEETTYQERTPVRAFSTAKLAVAACFVLVAGLGITALVSTNGSLPFANNIQAFADELRLANPFMKVTADESGVISQYEFEDEKRSKNVFVELDFDFNCENVEGTELIYQADNGEIQFKLEDSSDIVDRLSIEYPNPGVSGFIHVEVYLGDTFMEDMIESDDPTKYRARAIFEAIQQLKTSSITISSLQEGEVVQQKSYSFDCDSANWKDVLKKLYSKELVIDLIEIS